MQAQPLRFFAQIPAAYDQSRTHSPLPSPPCPCQRDPLFLYSTLDDAAAGEMTDMLNKGRRFERINFLSSAAPEAEEARARLVGRYGDVHSSEANVVVALGGDGLMLQTLHKFMGRNVPIYGMNRGLVRFLMNEFRDRASQTAVAGAKLDHPPLAHDCRKPDGEKADALAINEVSLLRQSAQASKLRVLIDGHVRLEELIADGILVSSPAGSTAYNLSANGPILPLDAPLMALTPISAFRPRRWRGALLSDKAEVRVEVLEAEKRPVAAVADHFESAMCCSRASPPIIRPGWSCCTTPAIPWKNAFYANNSGSDPNSGSDQCLMMTSPASAASTKKSWCAKNTRSRVWTMNFAMPMDAGKRMSATCSAALTLRCCSLMTLCGKCCC